MWIVVTNVLSLETKNVTQSNIKRITLRLKMNNFHLVTVANAETEKYVFVEIVILM